MKKALILGLAMAFLVSAAPVFAAGTEPANPCVKPASNKNAEAVQNYEFCMAEYIKSLKLTGKEREDALAKAEAALKAHLQLKP